MNILVTLNSNYLRPLKVMLKSLFINNPGENFSIYLMHSSIKDVEINKLDKFIKSNGSNLKIVSIDEKTFEEAPILLHYTREMYYRLLAFKFIPPEMDRILYLDPDILVINPIKELYNLDIKNYLYAAAYHDAIPITGINRIRFKTYDIKNYYNTGVLLMNLENQRNAINEKDIFKFVKDNYSKLIMPDQDIMNSLYSKDIRALDEKIYNYDARKYLYYKYNNNKMVDMDYIIRNTVILHFCGKKKPWLKKYSGVFYSLYKHYEHLALDCNINN